VEVNEGELVMAVKHTRLARNVSGFTGTVRAVYKTIADHASPGPHPNKGDRKKKHLPEGWTSIGLALMMKENCIVRVETLTHALKVLVKSGAIEQKIVSGLKWHRFDSKWAEAHQWNASDVEIFRCKASLRYRTKKAKEALTTESVGTVPAEITTEDVVSNNGRRCNEVGLQRIPPTVTTENRTVVHSPSGVHSHEEKRGSDYVNKIPVERVTLLNSFEDQKPDQQPNPGGMNPPVPPVKKDDKQDARPAPLFDDTDLWENFCYHNVDRKTCPKCGKIAEARAWAEKKDAANI
jgi:hypothetical protein